MTQSLADFQLPEVCWEAFQAYNAMEATKDRHVNYLKLIEQKYQRYGQPSELENKVIANFLHDHDQMVMLFKNATSDLREKDQTAHVSLLKYIMLIQDHLIS